MRVNAVLKSLGRDALKKRVIGSEPLESIQKIWSVLSKIPRGNVLLSKLIGRFVPYTGSINPEILELRPGYCRIQIADRPKLRNHLNSIHALAIANLGEAASGLALNIQIPQEFGAILVRLEAEYVKKARGVIVAESNVGLLDFEGISSVHAESIISDSAGQKVALIRTEWKIGKKPEKRPSASSQKFASMGVTF